jgi:hypothetical protein
MLVCSGLVLNLFRMLDQFDYLFIIDVDLLLKLVNIEFIRFYFDVLNIIFGILFNSILILSYFDILLVLIFLQITIAKMYSLILF